MSRRILPLILAVSVASCSTEWHEGPAVLALALTSPCGDGLRLATGSTVDWDVPASIPKPGTYSGAEFDWTLRDEVPGLGIGVSYFGGDSGEDFTTATISYDIGLALSGAGDGPASWWIVVRPEVGVWHWSQASDEDGLLVGAAFGFGGLVGEKDDVRHLLGIEFKWQALDEVAGDETATVGKLLVTYSCYYF